MSNYVSEELRRLVVNRAQNLCEYCLIHESDTFFGCQIDHIVSLKHSGLTEAINLAYACSFCNRNKGSDIASLSGVTGELVRFFNPRTDLWSEHFRLQGGLIDSLTSIGDVTARILKFNESERVLERKTLIAIGRYPSEPASVRMR
jgi:hypothetical protein